MREARRSLNVSYRVLRSPRPPGRRTESLCSPTTSSPCRRKQESERCFYTAPSLGTRALIGSRSPTLRELPPAQHRSLSEERQPRTHQPQPRPTSQCQEAPTPAWGGPAPRPTRPPPTPPTPPPTPPTTPPTPQAGGRLPIRPTAPTFRRSLLLQLLPQ